MSLSRFEFYAFAFAGCGLLLAACKQAPDSSQAQDSNPTRPDLAVLEQCAMSDLGRYWGATYRFHRDGCWADVAFDDSGQVLSFKPNDAALCERVLDKCR